MYLNCYTKQFLRRATLIFPLAIFSSVAFAQVYTNKEVGNKNEGLKDSLKNATYPYSLPIWGKKVARLVYDLEERSAISMYPF